MRTILILETPARALAGLARAVRRVAPDWRVESLTTAAALERRLEEDTSVAVVFIERTDGDGREDGLAIVRRLRATHDALPLIAVAPFGNVEVVEEAVKAGATTFLVLGEKLEGRVSTALGKIRGLSDLIEQNRRLTRENDSMRERFEADRRIVGRSPRLRELLDRVRRVAMVPRPVLVIGERGTGKELVARLIHEHAFDRDRPLVTVNCAAFAESLLEGELFGHEKGAFTGADRAAAGKFEQADGGTLFLDEIGSMSLAFQQKVLRAVEYGLITRVGGSREISVKVRIIAATNADLERMMREGKFLPDLYDRLAFEVINVPPLRDRPEDIPVLAEHFLAQFMREIPAFAGKRLADSAIEALLRYSFPGNIRELKNIIERAAYRDTTDEITPGDLGLDCTPELDPAAGTFEERVEAFKARLLREALDAAKGNQAEAARRLGLSYHQFRYYHRTLVREREPEPAEA